MSINGWIDREDMICLYTGILCVCMLSHFSHVQLFAMPWTVARQTPLSMGFSRQVYWSRLPCPPPGDLPDPAIKPLVPPGKPSNQLIMTISLWWDHWFFFLKHSYFYFDIPIFSDFPIVNMYNLHSVLKLKKIKESRGGSMIKRLPRIWSLAGKLRSHVLWSS